MKLRVYENEFVGNIIEAIMENSPRAIHYGWHGSEVLEANFTKIHSKKVLTQIHSALTGLYGMAEEYFSRLRRAEAGHHHHIAGAYLLRYAQGGVLARG